MKEINFKYIDDCDARMVIIDGETIDRIYFNADSGYQPTDDLVDILSSIYNVTIDEVRDAFETATFNTIEVVEACLQDLLEDKDKL